MVVSATACHDYRGLMCWLTLPLVTITGADVVVNATASHDYRGLMWCLTLPLVMIIGAWCGG